MKKEEIINAILENSDMLLDDIKGKKVSELKELYSEVIKNTNPIVAGISETDPGWSDYVMSNFSENELKDGMPTCDGLRRVFKKLVGQIISCYMDVIKAPTLSDPTATVSCSLTFQRFGSSKSCSVGDVFDVNPDNTPWPYCKASTATAATKAEARALRKALGLVKVYSAEEIQEGMDVNDISMSSSDGNKNISDSAKIAINTMSNRLGIKPVKLFAIMGIEKQDVSTLTYSEGHAVLSKLNSFTRGEANGGESIPQEIKSSEIII